MATQEPHVATTNPEQRLKDLEDHIKAVVTRIEAIEQSLRPTAAKGKAKE